MTEKHGENTENVENSGENTEKVLKNIRRQVKNYHDAVSSRAEELEEPRPVWDVYEVPPMFLSWGRSLVYHYLGDAVSPPRGVEDELEFTRQELKMWSKVHKLEKTGKDEVKMRNE